jgi:hypothetical protein
VTSAYTMVETTVVNQSEASELLTRELEKLRGRSYQELLTLREKVTAYELVGGSGTVYTVEFRAVWDDKANGHLRVMGDIDDGVSRRRWLGILSEVIPMTDSFTIAPDGSSVGGA